MPSYRTIITDLSGNSIDEVPAKNLSFSYILNSPGAVSFTLHLYDVKTLFSTLLAGAREIHIIRDSSLVWGGYLWTHLASMDNAEVQFGGEGYWSRIRRRYIKVKKTYTAQDQFDIAWDLINYTQTQPNGNLGITRFSSAPSGVNRTGTYELWERKLIGEAIEQLSARNNGFDFEVTPDKLWKTYYPSKGSNKGLVFELGKNVEGLSWDYDATQLANEITALGSGEGASKLLSVVADATSQSTYGLLQDTRSFTDVKVQSTLDDHATEELRVSKNPRDNPQINGIITTDMSFSDVTPGDSIRIRANLGFILLDKTYRVTSITVNVSDTGEEAFGLFFNELTSV